MRRKSFYNPSTLVGYAVVLLGVMGSLLFVVTPEAERQAHLEAKYRDHRPKVEQPFLKGYNSLTNENFPRFIEDWRAWSKKREKEASDTMMNRYYELILAHYPGFKSDTDTLDYVVRRYCVSVFHSREKYHKNKSIDSYTFSDTTYMIPPAVKGKEVLYLTPEITKLLDAYLEWAYGWWCENRITEQPHPDHEEIAKRFIPVEIGGDIPGYYSYETPPDIINFYLFKNCMIAEICPDALIGDFFILPNYSIANYEIFMYWIV